jgi:hypothetical protein
MPIDPGHAFHPIGELKPVARRQSEEGFAQVQEFLERFGYLEPDTPERGTLCDRTAAALEHFQRRHGLRPTGEFDEDTRDTITTGRCALPDARRGVAFATTCAWNRTTLTYSFGPGTTDVAGDGERAAVRRALASWTAVSPVLFREVGAGGDVRVDWRAAADADLNMVGGTLAHADYPPGCSFISEALPKPVHFDDEEHTWSDGAVAGAFDVETVALHELGHILGLAHSAVPGAVMAPTIASGSLLRTPAPDDVEGVERLYPRTGHLFARHSGRVLDVAGASTANGAQLIQWDLHGGGNQRLRAEPAGGGFHRVVVQHSGKVLDVAGASTANGARIIQWPWHGGDNQLFRFEALADGSHRIVAKHSGKVLDVEGASTGNGARLIQWPWHGGHNQRFRHTFAAITARHSGLVLDVAGVSLADGAELIQWPWHGGGNQGVRIDPVDGPWCRLVVRHSGKVLDVEGASTANGARLIQRPWHGGHNQQFRVEPLGDGSHRLTARHSGKVLDVAGASTARGARVVQWPWHGGGNQRWRL